MKELVRKIDSLVDGWCERRAYAPLRIVLPLWSPQNGFSDESQEVWGALRHVRAMCRDELTQSGEAKRVDEVIAELSQELFPRESSETVDKLADRVIAALFASDDT